MSNARWRWLELLFVVVLFAAALTVRVYRLDEIPPGLWLDEAANGLDVLDILQGRHAVFFERNKGREGFFFYLQALVGQWAGVSAHSLRLTAAIVGAATIVATYWLVRTLFGASELPARWLAVWSSSFLVFSYWHLSLSRIGLRAITLPLLATLTFIFFWRAWRRFGETKAFPWFDLIACGGLLGLTLYTYTASRFIPLLLVMTMAAGLLFAKRSGINRRQLILALGVIGLVSLVVFAPLGYDFLTHPEHFGERAVEISIFSKEFAGDDPVAAFGESIRRTALMFLSLPDPNLRHNPAARPVFDPLLAAWLGVGIIIALVRWRDLPYLFTLLWFGVLALPALLTAQGAPHSLRSIGMLPAATILPVIGMGWAGKRLPARLARLAVWLPLPFLLFSSITGVRDYFLAWRDLDKFRVPFLLDYYQVGENIAQQSSPDSVWILPISPNYRLLDGMFPPFYTVEFLVRNRAEYGSVPGDEVQAPQRLAELTRGRRFVNLFRIFDASFFSEAPFVFDDTKNLVEFLLQKHGRLVKQSDGADVGMPYKVYELPPQVVFSVTEQVAPLVVTFDDKVKLIGLDYGRTVLDLAESPSALAEKAAPAGHALWAVMRWQAQTPLDFDLKTSLLLRDKFDHLAGQVDNLLVGDHYPVLRMWEAGEQASTYHILSTLPAIPPGQYHLYLKVYEDTTGRIYTAHEAAGQALGAEVNIGTVEITRSQESSTLTPERPLPDPPQLAPGLTLTGYDLPSTSLAPGDLLPVTLYWQATNTLAADYTIALQLLDQAGAVAGELVRHPGNDAYPTSQWRADEGLRDWHDLPIRPDLPTGTYQLVVSIRDGDETVGQMILAEIEVSGRPRLFTAPPIPQPISATFDQQVRLLGVDASAELSITSGATITFTLVWQALGTSPVPLVRFVHLLGADGHPVAQQDTIPCNAACPATSWLADEILLDEATLTIPPDLAAGTYRLGVGWYDQTTQRRLAAADDKGVSLADNLVDLPVSVEVR